MKILTTARNILAPIFIGCIATLITSSVYAACTSPAGNEGDLRWDSGNLKYCLGSNSWRTVSGTASSGACTNGTIQMNGSALEFCRSSTWRSVRGTGGNPGATGTGSCGSQTGEFYYDTGRDFYVFCNGSAWYDFW